jgi:hypothetical protein
MASRPKRRTSSTRCSKEPDPLVGASDLCTGNPAAAIVVLDMTYAHFFPSGCGGPRSRPLDYCMDTTPLGGRIRGRNTTSAHVGLRSGRVPAHCQGEGSEFESRPPLTGKAWSDSFFGRVSRRFRGPSLYQLALLSGSFCPEFVVRHWWAQALHNQSALALKARLLFRPNTAVTSLPIHP